MADLDLLLENPNWQAIRKYAFQPPNDNTYARWGVLGSVGANSPMWLYSNEYGHLAMKHGQNELLSYHGGIKNFAPSVTHHLQNQVHECAHLTLNPAGCQQNAVSKVYSIDADHINRPYHRHEQARNSPVTPHPYGAAYHLGYPPQLFPQPPPYGDQS